VDGSGKLKADGVKIFNLDFNLHVDLNIKSNIDPTLDRKSCIQKRRINRNGL